ncbi:MAG: CHRD domain-containing protein [Acidobacteriota bacterium]
MKISKSAFSIAVISAIILLLNSAALANKVFSSAPTGLQETPVNYSSAAGAGSVVLSAAETQVTVTLYFAGLTSTQTSAAIHGPATAGSTGAVIFALPNGSFTQNFAVTAQQAADLKAGLWYFEVRSSDIPLGEIRGQITAAIGTPVMFPSSNGMLDATFGTNGVLSTAVGPGNDVAQAVAIQSDGKIVAAGFAFNGSNNDFAIVRYNPNGTLDDTFDGNSGNGNGIILTPVGPSDDEAFGIVLQPDGKIILAGQTRNPSNEDVAVVRYNTDGTLDTTFDGDGRVIIPIGAGNDLARSVAVQADGKIVLVGNGSNATNSDIAIIRLESNGSLDTSFDGNSGNGNGIVTVPVGAGNDQGYVAAIAGDGKIVVAGYYAAAVSSDTVILRLNTDGRLDSTFDGDGIAPHSFSATDSDEALAMTLQPDGRIVIAGCIRTGGGVLNDFLIARFDQNGSVDNSFGTGGLTVVPFSSLADIALGVAVQPDGKIVATGFASNGSKNQFGVTRVNANGTPDTSFDGDGKMQTTIGTTADSANAIALQADGKIVIVGRAVSGGADFGVARYGYGSNALGNDAFIGLDQTTAIRFDSVYGAGSSSVTLLNAASLPPLPAGWSFIGSPRNINTSALFSDSILVRLTLPDGLTPANFAVVRILQYENGAWVDKTTTSPARDFASKTIYARISSLGPLAAASPGGPVSGTASVSGRLNGGPGRNAYTSVVTITAAGGAKYYTRVNQFGYFQFQGLAAGGIYLINPSSKTVVFAPLLIALNDELVDVNITAVGQ